MEIIIPGLQASIVLQSVIFTFFLFSSQRPRLLPSKLVLALMGILSVHMVFNLANQAIWPHSLPNLVFGFGLLYGPNIYLYINALIYKDFSWQTGYWLHFLPGVILSGTALFVQMPGYLGAIATFVSMGAYLGAALFSYKRFRSVIRQTQSAEDYIAMNWAAIVLALNAIVLAFNILSFVFFILTGKSQGFVWSEISLFVMLVVMVNTFFIKGLTQPVLFAGITDEDEAIEVVSRTQNNEGELDEEVHQRIEDNLAKHMASKQPYLDPMFSLQKLARQLGETPRNVSVYINRCLHLTFADFVNNYRLADVKSQILDKTDERTIIDIVYACGFSTKSNFNRAFKKHEGMTPTEFKKRALAADAGA
jgi:AraC-like DNA-binding protein